MVWACLGASTPRRHHALVVMCGDEPHKSIDPPDETPQFDHGDRSKRRRIASADPFMDAISSRTAHTPLARPTARELPPDEDEDWDESQHLLTQPPSPPRFQPPSCSSPSDAAPPQPRSTKPPQPPPPPPPPPAPPIVPFEEIPANRKSIIKRACSDVFSVEATREFQVTATHYLSFHNDAYLSLIRCTADGKSLVPLCTAAIRRKVTLILVPLHGLGSDQVEKSTLRDKGVTAYYLDQHKRENEEALKERLDRLTLEEAKVSSTILFVSPQVLVSDSMWYHVLQSLAERNLFSLFCIDEAHSINQDGRAFRVQFNDAVKSIQKLHSIQRQSQKNSSVISRSNVESRNIFASRRNSSALAIPSS
jgi:hypothetical protein